MRIIISPAKNMSQNNKELEYNSLPIFLEDTKNILSTLKEKNETELQNIWKCNDKLLEENIQRIKNMDLTKNLTPAILTYEGMVFKHLIPAVLEDNNIEYLQKNLRILSGFYGVLKPLDGITPYRLEMQSKLKIDSFKNLYDFWGDKIYREILDESKIIINLASKEYTKAIEKFLSEDVRFITCSFVEKSGDKLVTKGTYSKMARGEMARFIAKHNIENLEELKKFNELGYIFRKDLSSETEYIFERIY